MKIGMNMLLWTNHVTRHHYEIIDELKKTGFDGVELPLGTGDQKEHKALGTHLKEMDLEVTCVFSLLEDTNIASPDRSIREAGLERLKWAIDMAHAAGSKLICGPFHSAFAYFSRKPPTEDEKKWSAENMRKAAEYAQQAEIMLAPEALNRFECYLINTMEAMRDYVEMVDHPHVGAIYDTHHANIEEKSQKEAIEHISPHLIHVHISDNDRGTPGKGQVDFDNVFNTLKSINYNGWLTIESFSTNIPEFANAINVWRNFSPIEEVYSQGYEFIRKNWNA